MLNHPETLAGIDALISAGEHPLSNLANAAAALWTAMPDINWAGFYLLHEGVLWLGPFQGRVACTRIEPGRGVCGTAYAENRTIVVPDVHSFPGHIACDAASRAEIVIPLRQHGRPIGVMDIDSPYTNRFTGEDQQALERVAAILEECCDFTRLHYSTQP